MNVDVDNSSSESEYNEIIPKEMLETAKNLTMDLLPQKSKQDYTATYNAFKKWRKEMKTSSFDEIILLNYFDILSNKYAPNSLWAIYSKLKLTLNCYDHVDISKYMKLQSFLKRKSTGYQPKKSAVFTKDNIVKFLNDAPDEIYLATKVVLIMGIAGALRRCELTNLLTSDCLVGEDLLLVSIKNTKNKVPRSFTVMGELYDICKRYMNIRPVACPINRFFFKYAKGKCINQPIGVNKFGAMPKEIASFLMLPHANIFTGHSFRRTSATLLVDAEADITALKRHGGWKSNTVAEGYIADSLNNKKQIFHQITSGISLNNVTDTANTSSNVVVVRIEPAITQSTTSTHHEVQQNISTKQKIKNRNVPVNNDSVSQEAPSISQTKNSNIPVTEETPSTSQIQISNTNILVAGDSILDTINSRINKKDPKFPAFYDPDIGLFVHDMINGNPNKTIILNNCNVTLHGELNNNVVFNDCNIHKSP